MPQVSGWSGLGGNTVHVGPVWGLPSSPQPGPLAHRRRSQYSVAMTPDPIRLANRLSWNAATRAHNSHKADQAAFFRGGGNKLYPEEIELLGDVAGLDLLHLQCNAGQDSLSLAQLGARVVGVDLADEAIAFARALSAESGVAATFEHGDVYEWLAATERRFDRVFCSYGALPWLMDLAAWARGVARVLRPGGALVVMEFHPVAYLYDEQLRLAFDYFEAAPIVSPDGVGDYVASSGAALAPSGFLEGEPAFSNPHACYERLWGIGEVVSAVAGAGLRVERLTEYPYLNGCRFYDACRADGRRWQLPEGMPRVPLMFGLRASG